MSANEEGRRRGSRHGSRVILLQDLEPAREVRGGSRKRLFGEAPTHPGQTTHQEERDMPRSLDDLDPTKSPKGGRRKKATRKKAARKKTKKGGSGRGGRKTR